MLGLSLAPCGAVQAQSVALAGMLGGKALLVVDGSAPKTVATGQTHKGVKVISISGEQAVIERSGQRQTLQIGDSPVSLGSGKRSNQIVLSESDGGHFMTSGQINGQTVQFMVDTGATFIAMGMLDAKRIGLNYKAAEPVRIATANGESTGYLIKLSSVRVGNVAVYEVAAVIIPQEMPFLLLGNSFLSRFQLKRDNGLMTLDKRY
ncbi:MAG: TIGR02281 family clan AA aspartic protease [Pseudomonadota bacterium]|nr:TIGR02281 family clan AA aspartic protease [Pseudomonadota bacterium]